MSEKALAGEAMSAPLVSNNIAKIYLVKGCFCSLSCIVPVMVVFLMEQGLSLSQILLLEGIFALALAVFDSPGGYFADSYGRKTSIVSGSLMFLLGGCCYMLGNSFADFLVAELFFAAGIALVGGADQALVYDSLAQNKEEGSFQKVCGNIFCLEMTVSAVGAVIGGLIALVSLRAPFLLAMLGFACMFFASLTLVEPERQVRKITGGRCQDFYAVLKKDVLQKKAVLWVICIWAVMFSCAGVGFWLYQPYMKLCAINIAYFGWIYAGMNIFGAYWAKNAYRVEKKLGLTKTLWIAMTALGASFLILATIMVPVSPVLFLVHQFVRGTTRVLLLDKIQKLTDSSVRATVTSIVTTFSSGFYALSLLILSGVSGYVGVSAIYYLLGLVVLLVGGVLLMVKPHTG